MMLKIGYVIGFLLLKIGYVIGFLFVWSTWPLIVPVWAIFVYTKQTTKPFFKWYREDFVK